MTLQRTPGRPRAAERCVSSAVSDAKFWAKTRPEGECIVWTGYRDRQGYGTVLRPAVSRSPMLTHRYAYLLTHGSLEAGAVIRHTCDNPPCVRPDHLLTGTQADNIADRQARGRHRPGRLLGEAHPAHKLTAATLADARADYLDGDPLDAIAARYGVSKTTIYNALRGKNWTEEHQPIPMRPRGRPRKAA